MQLYNMHISLYNYICNSKRTRKFNSNFNLFRQFEERKVPPTPEGHFCSPSCSLRRSHGVLHRPIHSQGIQQLFSFVEKREIENHLESSFGILVKVFNLQGFEKERWEIKGWVQPSPPNIVITTKHCHHHQTWSPSLSTNIIRDNLMTRI